MSYQRIAEIEDNHVAAADELGFLIINEKGVLVKSGGQLEQDDKVAKIVSSMIRLIDGETSLIASPDSLDMVTVQFEDHLFSITVGQKRVKVVKRKYAPLNPVEA